MGLMEEFVRQVVYADRGIIDIFLFSDDRIGWLLETEACQVCASWLVKTLKRDALHMDLDSERRRALGLLLILAAMGLELSQETNEALKLLGARNVETRGRARAERFRRAGEARIRPICAEGYYAKRYVGKMVKRLAEELYVLVTQPDHLARSLAKHGDEAMVQHH